jgi:hypothetical protein
VRLKYLPVVFRWGRIAPKTAYLASSCLDEREPVGFRAAHVASSAILDRHLPGENLSDSQPVSGVSSSAWSTPNSDGLVIPDTISDLAGRKKELRDLSHAVVS